MGAAFTLAQLLLVPLSMGLSWDETVYASQVAPRAVAEFFSAPRSRGITLLIAPLLSVTSTTAALRLYLAVLSGLGLFLALLAWRRVRDTRAVALAGALFAGLWVTVYYGPQAMPNLWIAFCGVAAVGCFLAAVRDRSARGPLLGLGASLAVAALMRPSDAALLALPLLLAAAVVPRWRRGAVAAVIAGGLVAGSAEWVAEAYVRFGGVGTRLHLASVNEGGLGPHWALGAHLRSLDGPTLCRPCAVPWHHPVLSAWWLALPLLVAGGTWVGARARGLAVALLPVLCAVAVAAPYLFLIDYAAPRFLLPAYALLAFPVADLLVWLALRARPGLRPWTVTAVGAVLAVQFASQFAVLAHNARATAAGHADDTHVAVALHRLGLRAPCLLTGNDAEPLAWYSGCAAAETTGMDASATPAQIVRRAAVEPTALLRYPGQSPPAYARSWRPHRVPGLGGGPSYIVYLAPASPR